MNKYLPTQHEARIAIFSAIATVLVIFVGGALLRSAKWAMHGGYGSDEMNMVGMHKMGDGKMMMNSEMYMPDDMDHGASMMDKGTLMSGAMMDMTMNDMVTMMEGKTGKALEKEFIIGMIPHHQGAVEMSKKLLEDKTISTEMKKFAEDIIKAQEGEIKMMNEWLKKY